MVKKYRKPAEEQAKETLADLWPGQSAALLKALHILTRDGALNADSRRKLKQVLHLANLIRPALDWALARLYAVRARACVIHSRRFLSGMRQPGAWHTASTLLPSGSSTNAP